MCRPPTQPSRLGRAAPASLPLPPGPGARPGSLPSGQLRGQCGLGGRATQGDGGGWEADRGQGGRDCGREPVGLAEGGGGEGEKTETATQTGEEASRRGMVRQGERRRVKGGASVLQEGGRGRLGRGGGRRKDGRGMWEPIGGSVEKPILAKTS